MAQRPSVVSGTVRRAILPQADAVAHLAAMDLWAASGPWEVSVALPGALGAVLGAFASGWAEPDRAFDVYECGEDDPLVTLELAAAGRRPGAAGGAAAGPRAGRERVRDNAALLSAAEGHRGRGLRRVLIADSAAPDAAEPGFRQGNA